MANSKVSAIAKHGNTVYLAGNFDFMGPNEGRFTVLDSATGNINTSFPKIYFYSKMIEDGNGGWFVIGPDKLEVGGQTRNRLAHVYANGTLSAWNPNPNGSIADLKISGGKVYVAGMFDSIGGQKRKYLAALDTITGLATDWNVNINQTITALAVTNNTVYVAGQFTFIGGQVRGVLAAFDAVTAQITSWNPSGGTVFSASDPDVKKLESHGNTIYAGGNFTSIGGQLRNGLAAIDATTGSVTAFNPGTPVNSWVIKNNLMYVAGSFTDIGGQARPGLAALNLSTGAATSWNPVLPVVINYTSPILAVNGNRVYVALSDTPDKSGAQGRWILAVDASSGVTTSWSPIFEYTGYFSYQTLTSVAAGSGEVFAAGSYNSVNGQERTYLAALDATTGALTNWHPAMDMSSGRQVQKLLVSGNTMYAIGNFLTIDGLPRNGLAAFDLTTGLITPWDPNPNNTVTDIAVKNGVVYLSGAFTKIGGQIRNYLAAVDSATGLAKSWAPVVDATVNKLAIAGNFLYVTGQFTSVASQARTNLAAFNLPGGTLTPWAPNPDQPVISFASNSSTLYMYGYFSNFAGQPVEASKLAGAFAAIDITTNAIKPWNPHGSFLETEAYGKGILSLAANDTAVYLGGGTYLGTLSDNVVFLPVDAVTGIVKPWHNTPNSGLRTGSFNFSGAYIDAIELDGNRVYMGGTFLNVGDYSSPCFAVFGEAAGDVVLPIRSINLRAQQKGNAALISWQVNEEDDIAKYLLQKSSDGQTFVLKATKTATGAHAYETTDDLPLKANFYRIKAVTKSGDVIYSKVVKLDILGKSSVTVYPNPVTGNEIQLQLNAVEKGNYRFEIYNIAGQKLLSEVLQHEGGSTTISADVSKVPPGANIIILVNESGEVISKERWVKL